MFNDTLKACLPGNQPDWGRAIAAFSRASTRKAVSRAVGRTAKNDGMKLGFALSYGGRAEIVDAALTDMSKSGGS